MGDVNLGGFNLIQSTSGANPTETANPSTNIIGLDPMLDSLANNGGPTETHRLASVSPAIDPGKNSATLRLINVGVSGPLTSPATANAPTGDGSDIGAYEVQDETPQSGIPSFIVNTADDHDDGFCTDQDCTLREAILAANADPDPSTITFDIPGAGPHVILLENPLDDLVTDMNIQGPTLVSVEVRGDLFLSIFTILEPMAPCLGSTVAVPVVSISNLTVGNLSGF